MNRGAVAVALVVGMAVTGCSSGTHSASKAPSPAASSTTAAPGSTATAADTTTTAATRAPAALVVSQASWQLPEPLSREVALAEPGGLVLLGGLNRAKQSTAGVVRIDPGSGTARRVGTLAAAVHDAAGVMLGGVPFVFGGGEATTVPTIQTFRGGVGAVVGRLPQSRSDLSAVTADGKAWVLGGFDGTNGLADVLTSTDGVHFTVAGKLADTVRYAAVAAVGGTVWIVGGEHNGAQLDIVQAYDTRTGTTRVAGRLPHPLAHAAAFVLGEQVYIAGGRQGSTTVDQVLRLDPRTEAVTDAGRLPAPVADAAAVTIADTAWLLGGERPNPVATVVTFRLGR